MKPALWMLTAGICLTHTLPLSAQDRARGKDLTPPEVQETSWKWSKEEREDKSLKARMAKPRHGACNSPAYTG